MYHAIFLLDYNKFRDEALPLAEEADKGNYIVVLERAKAIVRRIKPKDWILEDLGTTIKKFPKSLSDGGTSHIVGLSFLVILSKYLEPIPFATPGWGNVATACASLNWSKNDVTLLRSGMATTTLLKPDAVSNPLDRPPADDKRWHNPAYYWWWLRPANAFYIGWWNVEQLEKLQDSLRKIKERIGETKISDLNFHPSVTSQTLIEDYSRTAELFSLAVERQVGLFYIVK